MDKLNNITQPKVRLNQNLRELRRSMSKTQDEVAKEANIPLHSYISYERTTTPIFPKADSMKALIDYFDLGYEDLMYATDIVRLRYEKVNNIGGNKESVLRQQNQELQKELINAKEKVQLLEQLVEAYKKNK